MGFSSGMKVCFHAEMQLHGSGLEPDPATFSQILWLGYLTKTQ